jgi:LuxR family maltose regulon positive regulatory protein
MKILYWSAQGDLLAADAAVQEAVHLPQFAELPARVVSRIYALKVLIYVRSGKLEEAEQVLRKRGIRAGSPIRYPYHPEFQALAALLIAQGDLPTAETVLDSLVDWAEATKQYRTLICARVLQAVAHAAQKETQKAMQYLDLAMDLAEPENSCLPILEVGQPVLPLLYEAVQKGVHAAFATRLVEVFQETRPKPGESFDKPKHPSDILTPLRPREIEVLMLAADGQTNKEIAQKLHLSLRTIKFHMTCILTKLGVENRLQAVARAKNLGMIP